MPRRFPAPWTAEPIPGGFVVRDATCQALAYCTHVRTSPAPGEAQGSSVLTGRLACYGQFMASPVRPSTHLVTTQTPSESQSLQTVMSFVPCVQLSARDGPPEPLSPSGFFTCLATSRSATGVMPCDRELSARAASCIAAVTANSMTAASTLVSEIWGFMVSSFLVRIGLSANLPLGRDEGEFGSKAQSRIFG